MEPETVVVAETPPSQPAVEATADAAVEIATVEAERDVTIAATQAEAAVAIAEADATDDEDVIWLKGELADLRALCATNAAALSDAEIRQVEMTAQIVSLTEQVTALALLIQPPLSPEPQTETEAETQMEAETPASENAGDREAAQTEIERETERQRVRRYLR